MLRKAILKRGNKIVSAGAVFHTTEYFKVDKMDKKEHYPLEVVAKDGVVYVKLPPELVQLLR